MKNLLEGRAGNHTWNNIQPANGKTIGVDRITGNLTRSWVVETRSFDPRFTSWGSNSTGPLRIGKVPWNSDGTLNSKFYRSLEEFVSKAEKREIAVVVTLFEGTFQQYPGYRGGWKNHWTSELDNRPESPEFVHTKGPWNEFQRNHVKRVAKVLSGYDNVTGMVGNELHRNSVSWFQPKVVKWWKRWSESPIGVGYAQGMKPSSGRSQDWMARVGADWISPAGGQRIPGFTGNYIFDTDHSWPLRSNVPGLQSAKNRGDSILLMDGFFGDILRNQGNLEPDRNYIRSIL